MKEDFRIANPGLCKLGIALASFMQVLDMTIANVSLPSIAGNLGATTQQATWVVTSFSVSTAIALPLTGWLVRRFGEVRLFLVAVGLFTLSSMLCGLAPNMGMLTVFRTLQGFVAGPIIPVTQALMIFLFPSNRRTQAIALITIVTVVAPIVGPILGGWITDNYSWPWIFFINVPVGIFACIVVWSQMRHKPEQTQREKMDYTGLVLLALGVGALQIMLDKGNDEAWFDSNFIIATAIISAVSLTAFLIWSLTEKQPVVDLHLFRHRNFTVAALAATLFFGVYIAAAVLIPLWLQTQLHYTPIWAGLAVAPVGVMPVLLGSFIGKHGHKLNLRLVSSSGFAILATGFYLRCFFNLDVNFAINAYLQLFSGVGLCLGFIPLLSILVSDLKPEEISSGIGLSMFMRMLSSSFIVSISQYQWNSRAILHHSQLAERFAPGSPAMVEAVRSLGQGDTQLALVRLDQIITGQAYQISFNEIFFAFSLLIVACSLLVWFTKPPFQNPASSTVSSGH